MTRERSSFILLLLGVLWLAIAAVWGYTLYTQLLHLPNLLTYGLSALLAGMFIGRGIQQMRANRAAKRARKES